MTNLRSDPIEKFLRQSKETILGQFFGIFTCLLKCFSLESYIAFANICKMAHLSHNKYNYNEPTQAQSSSASGGILTYVYKWKITNWSEVRPYMEHTSPSFSADGLQWFL